MTPEERKAIAMRPGKKWSIADFACERFYPRCCQYHAGFDDALGLLVPTAASHLWSIKEPRTEQPMRRSV